MYNKNKPLASIAKSQYKLAKKLQGIDEYEMPKFYKFDQLKLMQSIASSQKIIEEKYNPEPGPGPEPEEKNYFYVENPGNKSISVTITKGKDGATFDIIEISDDKENWTELILDNNTYTFDVPATSKVYLRAEQSYWNGWKISSTGKDSFFNVGGNIMSLLYGENFEDETTLESIDTFKGLFKDSSVVDASELILPATTITDNCYAYMFRGCTSLTTAPQLPATELVYDCYGSMFSSCESLTEAPQLPATTLADWCYRYMFMGCTSLNKIITCANDISASSCLDGWLDSVAPTGTFYNLGRATYKTGASGIPSGWTEETSEETSK